MSEENVKRLEETEEGGKIKMNRMLKKQKRNYSSSFGCNNSSTFDTSRSEYKPSTRQ